MPWANYAKQRTWYGSGGSSVTDHKNWTSPYNNYVADGVSGVTGKQYYGQMAIFASSVAGTDYFKGSTSATFDTRVVRYIPLQVAMNDNAMGTAVATLYNTKKTDYDSAKTMWNNYVAILTKNSKVDAFAAAFSPPKAPTVPPLPNMPWLPDVSATLNILGAQNMNSLSFAGVSTINSALQPTTNQFWMYDDSVALQSGGGWGSFTATVMKYRNGWGKSYGTIGYESTTSNTSFGDMGAVYKQAW